MKHDQLEWFSGPPPAIGWWPASNCRLLDAYRWFDGKFWSGVAFRHCDKCAVEDAASVANRFEGQPIEWRNWSVEIDGTDGVGAHE